MVNICLKRMEACGQVFHFVFECLESDHEISLGIDADFIGFLVEHLAIGVKVGDSFVKFALR